jgi:outer membrane protein assembly factor BamE (lipoprotein component of BamABCDE complex)
MRPLSPLHFILFLALFAGLSGCGAFESSLTHGYIPQAGALDQVPVGSSKEQVQFVLGTPSTVSSIDGDVYYYISQQVERSPIMGVQVQDQHVLAIYFDKNQRVSRIANYGLSDGKIIDTISRKTPTGGNEVTFLQQIFNAISRQ